jgi:GT2 family glycosyltransferase
MFLSLIFVTHRDRIQVVKRLLKSLEGYRGEEWLEVICVDNGSLPSASTLIEREYPYVRTVRNEENAGTSRAYNAGIRLAKGTYLLIINDDSLIPEGMLEMLRGFLREHPGTDGLALGLKKSDGSYQALRLKILNLKKHHPLKPTRATFVGTGNLLIRKEVIEKTGMFDENYFAGNEDMDLSHRLKKAGVKLVFHPKFFIYHLHIYKDRKTGWLDFLVARRLSDLYYTKKFYPLLMPLERVYAYRNIMKKAGGSVDEYTAMKIKALIRIRTSSYYKIQKSLVSKGIHETYGRFVEAKPALPLYPSPVSASRPTGGSVGQVLEKLAIRRALEVCRPVERLVYDFHLTDKTVHEISYNLGINERVVESLIRRFSSTPAGQFERRVEARENASV